MYPSKRAFFSIFSLIAIAALLAGCSAADPAAASVQTAPVQVITAVTTVTGSGSTLALQTVPVSWKATGTVGTVNVKAGDQVKAGDVLMTIDPKSIPNMAQLQSDLLSSQKALNDLLHPTDLSLANAQQAVVKAQNDLDTAQKTLTASKSVDVPFFQEQVQKAQDALTNAEQNSTLTDIGSLTVQLRQAEDALTTATNVYNNAKDAFAKCPACLTVFAYDRKTTWQDAVNLYTDATNKVTQIQTQIDQAQRSNTTSVVDAQTALNTAQANLAAALQGPVTLTVQVNEAAVQVAQASVANAQQALTQLQNPDPVDVAAAQAKVANAQAALDAFTLKAPVDGEVTEVNYQPGDNAGSATAAVVLTNRSHVRVDALVDESDVAKVKAGDPVTITVDALNNIALPGTVVSIDPTGTATQGLVKYTVRVDATQPDPSVLLGMTASVSIITNSQAGALAVPLQALQYDTQGEFVNLVEANGNVQRVAVQSGQIQGNLVVVQGSSLKGGDQVELITSQTATTNNTNRGFGFGGLVGGGGGGGAQPGTGR